MRDGRPVTVEVTSDRGLVADKLGSTEALSLRLAMIKQRRRGHDPGRVIRDLAVMLADGGECVSDLGAVRDQQALFGPVASDSTAFRVVDRVAAEPALMEALRVAHARARERFWVAQLLADAAHVRGVAADALPGVGRALVDL